MTSVEVSSDVPVLEHTSLRQQRPSNASQRFHHSTSSAKSVECSTSLFSFGAIKTQLLAAVASNMGALAFGTVMSYTATALPDIRVDPVFGSVSLAEESWIGAIVPLGAAFAGPIAGYGVEKFGRKMTMLMLSIPFMLGWFLIGIANSIPTVLVGRFITGICGGSFAIAAPIFVGEIADASIRGTLAAGFELMICVGMLYIFVVGNYVKWRAQAFICGIIPVVMFLILLLVHESPRYLLGKGRTQQAAKSLAWYRGASATEDVLDELAVLQKRQDEHTHATAGQPTNCFSILDLIRYPNLKPVSIVMILFIFQELSAIDAICFYTVDIFQSAGVDFDSYYSTIVLGIVQLVSSAIASLLVDRCGRRFFLLLSEFFMTLALAAFGVFFYVKSVDAEWAKANLQWLPLISLVTFVIAYSIGLGPVAYMILGEILPKSVKGLASSVLTAFKWIVGFAVTRYFGDLVKMVGPAANYWLFSTICALGTVYIWFFVPETKGKTLEEIQDLFEPPEESTELLQRNGDAKEAECYTNYGGCDDKTEKNDKP